MNKGLGMRMLRWADRNRLTIVATMILLFVMPLAALSLLYNRGAMPRSNAEALFGLARLYYRNGQYEDAERVYEKLMHGAVAPTTKLYYAKTLFRLHKYEQAEKLYRELLEGTLSLKDGTTITGDVERLQDGGYRVRLPNGARKTWTEAEVERASPANSPLALFNLGQVLQKLGRLEDARRCFKRIEREYSELLPYFAERARSMLWIIENRPEWAMEENDDAQTK